MQQLFKPKFTDVSLEQLRRAQQMFAAERDWDQFHTPRNLLLALVGEVGELSELFQWKPDMQCVRDLPGFSPAEKTHVAEEISDVLLYLIRLADICGVDLGHAVLDKLQKNAVKYPIEKCRGSSAKYTQYHLKKDIYSKPKDDKPLELDCSSEMQSKRKRFTDQQVEVLTQVAENANWSLLSLSQEERDNICLQYGISKERLQNFFNNRKPKELKKPRPRGEGPDGTPDGLPGLPGTQLLVDSRMREASMFHHTPQQQHHGGPPQGHQG